MALPGEIGWVGKACPDCKRPLKTEVLRSAAGYFVGTTCVCDPVSPFSRESSYYPTRAAAEDALRDGTVAWRDTEFHGGRKS